MKKKKYSKEAANSSNQVIQSRNIFKNKGLWGLFFIILMIGSVLSLGFFNSDNNEGANKMEYNGYLFVNNGQGWITNIQGQQVAFEYLHNELQDTKAENLKINNNEIFLAYLPEEFNENSYEIMRLKGLLSIKGISAFPACLQDEGCGDLPIKQCGENTIIIKAGEQNKGYFNGKCYVLEGKNNDLIKIMNKFIYKIYGIIDENE